MRKKNSNYKSKIDGKQIEVPRIWITKDGQELGIAKMTKDHLLNTINFIEKRIDFYNDLIKQNMEDYHENKQYKIWRYEDKIEELEIKKYYMCEKLKKPYKKGIKLKLIDYSILF